MQYRVTLEIETLEDMRAENLAALVRTALECSMSDNWDYDVVDWEISKVEKA